MKTDRFADKRELAILAAFIIIVVGSGISLNSNTITGNVVASENEIMSNSDVVDSVSRDVNDEADNSNNNDINNEIKEKPPSVENLNIKKIETTPQYTPLTQTTVSSNNDLSASYSKSSDGITFTASVSDSSRMVYIIMFLDGQNMKSCRESPCVHTTSLPAGEHKYYIRAGFKNPSQTMYTEEKAVVV